MCLNLGQVYEGFVEVSSGAGHRDYRETIVHVNIVLSLFRTANISDKQSARLFCAVRQIPCCVWDVLESEEALQALSQVDAEPT